MDYFSSKDRSIRKKYIHPYFMSHERHQNEHTEGGGFILGLDKELTVTGNFD